MSLRAVPKIPRVSSSAGSSDHGFSPQQHRRLCRQRSNSLSMCPSIVNGDVNARDTKGRTALFYAARYGQLEVARSLVEAGCDLNIADKYNNTPLHEAVEKSERDIAKILIKYGCNMNAKNILGQTPLMRAVVYDDVEIIKLLHNSGANLEEVDCTGKTALLVGLQEARENACVYLLRSGCDVNIHDKLGQSALYIASHSPVSSNFGLLRRLIKSGYKIQKDSEWIKKSDFNLSFLEEKNLLRKVFKNIVQKFDRSKSNRPEKSRMIVDTSAEIDMPNFHLLKVH